MNKPFAILFAAVIGFGLTACKDGNTPAEPAEPTESTTTPVDDSDTPVTPDGPVATDDDIQVTEDLLCGVWRFQYNDFTLGDVSYAAYDYLHLGTNRVYAHYRDKGSAKEFKLTLNSFRYDQTTNTLVLSDKTTGAVLAEFTDLKMPDSVTLVMRNANISNDICLTRCTGIEQLYRRMAGTFQAVPVTYANLWVSISFPYIKLGEVPRTLVTSTTTGGEIYGPWVYQFFIVESNESLYKYGYESYMIDNSTGEVKSGSHFVSEDGMILYVNHYNEEYINMDRVYNVNDLVLAPKHAWHAEKYITYPGKNEDSTPNDIIDHYLTFNTNGTGKFEFYTLKNSVDFDYSFANNQIRITYNPDGLIEGDIVLIGDNYLGNDVEHILVIKLADEDYYTVYKEVEVD